jgi:hypothetical protein
MTYELISRYAYKYQRDPGLEIKDKVRRAKDIRGVFKNLLKKGYTITHTKKDKDGYITTNIKHPYGVAQVIWRDKKEILENGFKQEILVTQY